MVFYQPSSKNHLSGAKQSINYQFACEAKSETAYLPTKQSHSVPLLLQSYAKIGLLPSWTILRGKLKGENIREKREKPRPNNGLPIIVLGRWPFFCFMVECFIFWPRRQYIRFTFFWAINLIYLVDLTRLLYLQSS